MNLTINRDITDNKFSTTITFKEFGGLDITAEDEQDLLANYPQSVVLSDITFTGKYNVVNGEIVKDDVAGETVTIIINDKKIPLTNTFIVKYEVNTANINTTEVGTLLNTKELVAQAKNILFEDKVKEKIKSLLDAIKLKNNTFEANNPIDVTL